MKGDTAESNARSFVRKTVMVVGFGLLWCAGFLERIPCGFPREEMFGTFVGMLSGISLIAAAFFMRKCETRCLLRVSVVVGYSLMVGVFSLAGAEGALGDLAAILDRLLYALIFLGWIVAFFSREGDRSGVLVPMSFFCGSLITLFYLTLPSAALFFNREVVLAVSLGLLMVWSILSLEGRDASMPRGSFRARPSAKIIALRFAPVLFGGVAFSLTFGIMIDLHGWMTAPYAYESVQLINMAVAATLVVVFFMFRGGIRMDAVLTIALPLFAAALLIGGNEPDELSLSRIMMVSGYLFFWATAWVFTIRECRRFDFPAVMVFSLVSGLMLAVTQLGRRFAAWALTSFGLGSDQLSAVSLVLVWLMVVFSVALYWSARLRFVERDLAELEKNAVEGSKQVADVSSHRDYKEDLTGAGKDRTERDALPARDRSGDSSHIVYIGMTEVCYDAFKRRYGLSAREAEILADFARGRSAASLAEKHVISLNTVKTHLRRIYEKTGVHSRQELLDLIDEGMER